MNKRLILALAGICGLALFFSVSNAAGQAKQPKDIMILKGAPMGGVKFEHRLHAETHTAKKCETCHHAAKPEKAATAPQQACTACHTKAVTPPMKTNLAMAFHGGPMAQKGVCVDCHKSENAKGKKAPIKCLDCHKKENI